MSHITYLPTVKFSIGQPFFSTLSPSLILRATSCLCRRFMCHFLFPIISFEIFPLLFYHTLFLFFDSLFFFHDIDN